MLKTLLFDLDGTLLPMDQEEFTRGYFQLLAAKMTPHGYDAQQLVEAIWSGTAAMVKNDGDQSNELVFWKRFSEICGEKVLTDKPLFDEFYTREFEGAQAFCQYDPGAADTVRLAKQLGYRVALATNPIFPAAATEARIRWAGLSPEDFELRTSYENTGYCKPNPDYYRDIARRLDVRPEECLMVGNDVTEDMVAETIGMKVFLLTNCLINRDQRDASAYPGGDFRRLAGFLQEERPR
ncbi:MAG: HAD family hydrolase [Clostridiales bacterium]|nr:HAD family hydrolase [Clostridiales bacterium]